MSQRLIRSCRPVVVAILLCLLGLAGCTAHPVPVPKLDPTSEPTAAASRTDRRTDCGAAN